MSKITLAISFILFAAQLTFMLKENPDTFSEQRNNNFVLFD